MNEKLESFRPGRRRWVALSCPHSQLLHSPFCKPQISQLVSRCLSPDLKPCCSGSKARAHCQQTHYKPTQETYPVTVTLELEMLSLSSPHLLPPLLSFRFHYHTVGLEVSSDFTDLEFSFWCYLWSKGVKAMFWIIQRVILASTTPSCCPAICVYTNGEPLQVETS